MLEVILALNGEEIDRVQIVNIKTYSKADIAKYKVTHKGKKLDNIILHCRSEGARKLASRALLFVNNQEGKK